MDFEPPAKIPRVSRNRPAMSPGTAVYQAAMSGLKNPSPHPLLPKLVPTPSPPGLIRGRGRPQMLNRYLGDMRATSALAAQQKALAQMRPGNLRSKISQSNIIVIFLIPYTLKLILFYSVIQLLIKLLLALNKYLWHQFGSKIFNQAHGFDSY